MGEVVELATYPKAINVSTRFAIWLDEKLPTLEGDYSRKLFLTALLRQWEKKYGHFLRRCASDDPTYDPGEMTAWDFAMMISEISVRMSRYEGARQS